MLNQSSGQSFPTLRLAEKPSFSWLLENLEDMSAVEFEGVVRGLAKCADPLDIVEYHEVCRLVAESLELRLGRSFDDYEPIARGMIEDLPYNGLMGDTLYLVAMKALLGQCCKRGVGEFSPLIRQYCDRAIECIVARCYKLRPLDNSWIGEAVFAEQHLTAGYGLSLFMDELSSEAYNRFAGLPQFRAHLEKHIRTRSAPLRLAIGAFIQEQRKQPVAGLRQIDGLFVLLPDETAIESFLYQGRICRAFSFARSRAYEDFLQAVFEVKKGAEESEEGEQGVLPI